MAYSAEELARDAELLTSMKHDLGHRYTEYATLCGRLILEAHIRDLTWMPKFEDFLGHPDAAKNYLKYRVVLRKPVGQELLVVIAGKKVDSFQDFLKHRDEIAEKLKQLSS
jgi:hypothetical protein